MKPMILFLICLILAFSSSTTSIKKGFAQNDGRGPYSTRISDLNVNWFYTWNNTYPKFVPKGANWTAMVWGKKSVSDKIIKSLYALGQKGTIKELLGFNEPDNKKQSSMTVEEAIALWPQLMKTKLRLGSPAVAGDYEWLAKFMKAAKEKNYTVDFMYVLTSNLVQCIGMVLQTPAP